MSLANRTRAQRLGRSRFLTLLQQLSQQIDEVGARREADLQSRYAITREAERTGLATPAPAPMPRFVQEAADSIWRAAGS